MSTNIMCILCIDFLVVEIEKTESQFLEILNPQCIHFCLGSRAKLLHKRQSLCRATEASDYELQQPDPGKDVQVLQVRLVLDHGRHHSTVALAASSLQVFGNTAHGKLVPEHQGVGEGDESTEQQATNLRMPGLEV